MSAKPRREAGTPVRSVAASGVIEQVGQFEFRGDVGEACNPVSDSEV
ncbi:MAG: hypothetical protein H0V18_21335 [Pyrinomonadaceae bacterium]|nr:hypothetical protein [Pyrinomonadaceae bacterium]